MGQIRSQRPILKMLVVVTFSFIWFVICFGKIQGHRPEPRLDADWFMGLAGTLQQGSVSGRDFHFTYGPVPQILAWLGVALNEHRSVFDGYRLGVLIWYTTAIVLFGALVLCIGGLGPAYCAFLYLLAIALDLLAWFPFSDIASFRMLLVLLAVVAVARGLASETAISRRVWAAAGGALCFIGQLTTLELGVYAAAAATILCLGYLVKAYRSGPKAARSPLEALFLVAGIYLAGNLLVSAFFSFSSPDYSFFDYQRYGLEMLKGYASGMVMGWELDGWRTAGLVALTFYTAVAVWMVQGRLNSPDRAAVLGMSVAALLCLKNTLIRSDVTHIAAGMTPLVVVFLTLGPWVLPELRGPRTHWKHPAIWISGLLVLFFSWPSRRAVAADLWLGTESLLSGEFAVLRHAKTPPERWLPPAVLEALRDGGARPVVNFPYEHHIGVLLERRLVAPVLQAYNAGTLELQRYYVESLRRMANGDFDVSYSVDGIAAWGVDDVQTISRLPVIFDYLYRNFEWREYSQGLGVLNRREEPRSVEFRQLSFHTTALNSRLAEIRLPEPTPCGLLRLEMQVDYPMRTMLLKPAPLRVSVLHQQEPVVNAFFVPIAMGRPFDTYLSVLPPEHFFSVFGSEPIENRMWDRLIVSSDAVDWLSVPPQVLKVSRLACVDSERFRPLG